MVSLDPFKDDRGYYVRAFCRKELKAHGLNPNVVQMNTVFSAKAGTLRGMYYQIDPHAESKYVRYTRGNYDVMIDLRPESETYMQYFGVELTEDNGKMVFVPENFVHEFLTREDKRGLLHGGGVLCS